MKDHPTCKGQRLRSKDNELFNSSLNLNFTVLIKIIRPIAL